MLHWGDPCRGRNPKRRKRNDASVETSDESADGEQEEEQEEEEEEEEMAGVPKAKRKRGPGKGGRSKELKRKRSKVRQGRRSYMLHGWEKLALYAEGATEKDNTRAKLQLKNIEGAMSHTPSRQGVTHPCCRGAIRLGCSYHQERRDQQMQHRGALAPPHPLPPPSPGAPHSLTHRTSMSSTIGTTNMANGSFGAACLTQTGLKRMWSCNVEKTRSRCAHATQD